MHTDGTVLIQHDPAAVQCLHGAQIVKLNRAIVLRLDNGLLERLAGRSTNVERPHGQLRARFADGLRGDNTNRFPELDKLAGSQIAPVTLRAYSAAAFASQNRADF